MKGQVRPIPKGYHTVTPYLMVHDASQAIAFYKKAFGATEKFRMDGPGNTIAHAEIQIGDSRVMLADEVPSMNALSARTIGATPVTLMVYVEDVDAVFKTALKAGATQTRKVEDMFYGDRTGSLTDPFGHVWHIATHKEDLTPEEIQHRMMAAH
ncbi:MAG: VOC family protein [Holophaga sp.]|nr:VOC family protein [Holophaga sp.]